MADHFLIITSRSDDVDDADARDFAIECTNVTDACREWRECRLKECPANSDDPQVTDRLWDDDHAHGERHLYIDYTWMTPTDFCYVQNADEMPDFALQLAEKHSLSGGRHPVDFSFDEGRIEYLELVGTDGS